MRCQTTSYSKLVSYRDINAHYRFVSYLAYSNIQVLSAAQKYIFNKEISIFVKTYLHVVVSDVQLHLVFLAGE